MSIQRIGLGLLLLVVLLLAGCAPFSTVARVRELATDGATNGAAPIGTPADEQSSVVAERTPVPTPTPGRFHHHLLVEVAPDGIRETLVRLDGSEKDLSWKSRRK